jgi:hypothetical protein
MTTTNTAARQPATAAALATAAAAAELSLEGLGVALRQLADLGPVERARQAKVLLVAAQRVLAEAHREAVYEATRGRRYEDVAAELGVSKAALNAAVTRHLSDLAS